MTQSYSGEPYWLENSIRGLCGLLSRGIFNLLNIIYQIFFNVSSADIFNNEGIVAFFSRIQLLLGVFMVFQLAMIIIKGIVSPESIVGNPKKGQPSVIVKVVASLAMLALVVPLNISNASNLNEFEEKVNKNGLLFGTLYSLQYRVIEKNTFGRLILGDTDDTSNNYLAGNTSVLEQSAHTFTMGILKSFIKVNLKPGPLTEVENGDYSSLESNRMCSGISTLVDKYNDPNSTVDDIVDLVEETCPSGTKYYAFTFDTILAIPIGALFVFLFLSFTVDIAIRSIKLAILRLISPIPIISYMDPSGRKDSAFNSWVGLVTSTYLDLFFRVGIVYFVIFVINNMMGDSFTMIEKNGPIGVISQIIIWIGLLAFAKEAPKFFYQAFGIKGDPSGNIFGGLSKAMAVGAFATSGVKTAAANFNQARREYADFRDDPSVKNKFAKGWGLFTHGLGVGASLFTGAASGTFSAASGAMSAKQLDRQSINKAVNDNIALRRTGNTFSRRMWASAKNTIGFNSAVKHGNEDADMKMIGDRAKHINDWIDGECSTELEAYEVAKNSGDATKVSDAKDNLDKARRNAYDVAKNDAYMGNEIIAMVKAARRNGFKNKSAGTWAEYKNLYKEAAGKQYQNSTSYRRREQDAPYIAGGTAPNNGKK